MEAKSVLEKFRQHRKVLKNLRENAAKPRLAAMWDFLKSESGIHDIMMDIPSVESLIRKAKPNTPMEAGTLEEIVGIGFYIMEMCSEGKKITELVHGLGIGSRDPKPTRQSYVDDAMVGYINPALDFIEEKLEELVATESKEKSTESASSKISTAQTDEKKTKYGEGAYGQGVYGGGKVEGGEIEDTGTMLDVGGGVAEASIGGFSVSDQPAEIDTLGFDHYTTAIASFLGHKDTKAPLTMSIEGEWGSGKTSFMIQLEEKLRAQGGLSVRFSPWRHDKEDAVWAAFVMAFIDQLSDPGWLRGLLQNMKLLRYRFDWQAGWLEVVRIVAKLYVYLLVIVFMIIFLWVTSIQYISDLGFGGKLILSIVGAVATVGAVVLKGLKKAREVVGNPFEHDLKKYIQAPDYAGRISFVERFHKDFKEIVKTYAGDKKVYVFIDDLDRCEVPKAAELMKAINLMITNELNLIFIIGMDRQKVAAGLAVKDKELIRYLRPEMIGQKSDEDKISYWLAGLRYGYSFIEKFIQLPFGIPKPTLSDIDNMMASIRREEGEEELVPSPESEVIKEDIRGDGKKPVGSREEQEAKREEQRKAVEKKQLELKLANDSKQIGEIVHMVCSSLDFNPRRVKQFINLFRLRAYIAYETQLLILPEDVEVTDGVTLEQLGKIVAISLIRPLLLEALERDEFLLRELSEFAEKKTEDISSLASEVARSWTRDEQLMELISSGCVTEEGKQTDEWSKYTLKHANIDKLLQVSPRVRSMEVAPLEVSVSDDVKVSDAVGGEVQTSEKDMKSSEIEVNEGEREDANIIREAIARQLGKKPDELTDEDYANLETLNLSTSEISRLALVSQLTRLQRLYLSNTQVKDVEPLRGLTNLQRLYLSNTPVSDIEPLRGLTSLQRLDLSGTLVINLEPIKGFGNLQELNLWNSHVTDLGPIKKLKSLRELDIRGTQVSSLEPIKGLSNLKELLLEGCEKITAEQIDDLQKALPDCKIPSAAIKVALIGTNWRLFFNPNRRPDASKIMRFGESGAILEGRNNNESSWRIRNGFLELLDSDKKVHSRFDYNPDNNRFSHTNDPDTGSIRKHSIQDQYMLPEK